MSDAALGHREDAIREDRRAVELLPVTKDPMAGRAVLTNLAIIYAWTGEKDLALKQLKDLFPNYGLLSYGQLRLHVLGSAARRSAVREARRGSEETGRA
jgi:hypothetical protein